MCVCIWADAQWMLVVLCGNADLVLVLVVRTPPAPLPAAAAHAQMLVGLGGNTPTRDQFFLTFQLGLTASVLGAHTQLDENRLIGLRRTCPQQNSTAPDARPGEELWVSETIENVADVIQKSARVDGVAAGPGEKGSAVAIQ